MREEKEINCVYGSEHQNSLLFVYNGWYVCEGSVNVNKTTDDLIEGVDIELLTDIDCYTSTKPINSLEELKAFIDDDEVA